MSLEAKLDEILKNQGTIMKMLEDVLEAMPDPGQRPDVAAAMAPILNSPALKDNPAVRAMLGNFAKHMGGTKT